MKKILIIHVGGTIGMMMSGVKSTGKPALKPGPVGQHFLKLVPELRAMAKVQVQVIDNLDSSNVTPAHWQKWLNFLKKKYSAFDGFIFTHGTDTMAYTASAFSFALRKTSKPIVFTGSQRPLSHIRTDARDNLINSMEMACNGPSEISVCFGNELLRANRSTKMSATDYIAFSSLNFPRLAHIGVNVEQAWKNLAGRDRVNAGSPHWLTQFNERVFCFKIFPGISGVILQETITTPSCEGVVLEAFGSGNVPNIDDSVLKMLELAKELKKPVVIVSQCPHGQVDLNLYETGLRAKKLGAISAGDMTSETSVVKLMHGLGLGLRGQSLRNYILRNICGERST